MQLEGIPPPVDCCKYSKPTLIGTLDKNTTFACLHVDNSNHVSYHSTPHIILFFTKFGTFSCMRVFTLALWSYYCLNIPYSGKLSREKMFANFAVL